MLLVAYGHLYLHGNCMPTKCVKNIGGSCKVKDQLLGGRVLHIRYLHQRRKKSLKFISTYVYMHTYITYIHTYIHTYINYIYTYTNIYIEPLN